MKKLFTLLLFTLFVQYNFAQSIPECQFVPYPEMENNSNYSNRFQTIVNTEGPFVINIKFHGVHGNNGEDIHNVNEVRFLRMTARLNEVYNPYNIYFKYRGYNIVRDSEYINIGTNGQHTMTELISRFTDVGLYDNNAINIFVNHGASSGGALDVWCSTTFGDEGPYGFYQQMLPHEMGHTLGLYHVQSNHSLVAYNVDTNLPSCIMPPDNSPPLVGMRKPFLPEVQPSFQIENVTRDKYNPDETLNLNYNADIGGDKVTDTQACFNGFQHNYCRDYSVNPNFPSYPLITWNEHPEVIDMVGETYKCTAVESHNYMGIGILSFTQGQGQRMREHVVGNFNNIFKQRLNLLDDDTADMSVLYEPFAFGATGNTNPPSGTVYAKTMTPNEANTGVNVWNCGPFVARFQTGFNYEFSNPSGQIVNQTIYQQYNATCNGYISVKIPILGQDIIQTMEPMCFSSFEPYIKGEIKSLDNIGSFYFTIEELDSIKATNPDLYSELQSGKYHIIIKETESGYIDQKLIYKN